MKRSTPFLIALSLILLSGPVRAQRTPPGGTQNRAAKDSGSEPVRQRESDNDEPSAHVTYDPVVGNGDAMGSGEVEESKGVVSEQERMADGETTPPKTRQIAPSGTSSKKVKATSVKKSKSAKSKKAKATAKASKPKSSSKAHSKSAKSPGKKKAGR